MKRTIRFVLIAGVLGATVVASGALGRARVPGQPGTLEQWTSSQPAAELPAVPYFPAQYVLDAPAASSEPIPTF